MSNCAEKSGFLFDHDCRNAASGACQRCAKSVCAKHLHPTHEGYMCTTCAKKAAQTARRRGHHTGAWDDDPLLYSAVYYDGYGYYGRGSWGDEFLADDFTEADGDSFTDEGDGDWEHDMGAS